MCCNMLVKKTKVRKQLTENICARIYAANDLPGVEPGLALSVIPERK